MPIGKYDATWLLEYTDGRIKKGVFNNATQNKSDSAWAQNKTGLLRAGIWVRSGNVQRMVMDCTGQDFCNFEWVAEKSFNSGHQKIVGLTLVTRTERATFFLDGNCKIKKRDNSEDKLFHFGGLNHA
jgi:hypothetical protein